MDRLTPMSDAQRKLMSKDPDHRLWLRLRGFNKLKRGERVCVPYSQSAKRPKVGDVVEVRASGHHACTECEDEALRVAVVAVARDAAVMTTLQRTH